MKSAKKFLVISLITVFFTSTLSSAALAFHGRIYYEGNGYGRYGDRGEGGGMDIYFYSGGRHGWRDNYYNHRGYNRRSGGYYNRRHRYDNRYYRNPNHYYYKDYSNGNNDRVIIYGD